MKRIYLFCRGLYCYLKYLILGKEKALTRMRYGDLYYISFFSSSKFISLKERIIAANLNRIRAKSGCKVGFVIYTTSMWSLEGLYRLFEKDSFFRPYMLVAPLLETTRSTFEETVAFFRDNRYAVETLDDKYFDVNTYDFLIYTTPFSFSDNLINTMFIRLDKLLTYVSYSYILSAKTEKVNLPTYILSWKLFCDSPYYKKLIEKKTRVYSNNAIYCGYPKMDCYYQKSSKKECSEKKRKTIIYAPHQSVSYSGVRSATFEMNGWFLLYIANKYRDEIDWIIKPHPLLRSHSVNAGLFLNEEGYDDYLQRWKESGVAQVIENGDYMDSFIESDAMITDSISFLAEYQFTGKPLLLLESGKQTYNDFGNAIRNILYRCPGNDYNSIEDFIRDLIVGDDNMKPIRDSFFIDNLSYYSKNGKYAFEVMYDMLKKELLEYK